MQHDERNNNIVIMLFPVSAQLSILQMRFILHEQVSNSYVYVSVTRQLHIPNNQAVG